MTDQPNSTNDNQQPVESEQPSSQTQNSEHMIPKSRFDEVNSKYREMQAQLEQLQQAQQQQREKELAEQNRFKELYDEAQAKLQQFEQVQTQAQTYRETLEATNQARIAQIPESKRHLVPDFDDPLKLSAYLDRALPDLVGSVKPTPPSLDGGSGSGGSSKDAPALDATQQRLADMAQQLGYTVDRERVARLARNQQRPTDTGD